MITTKITIEKTDGQSGIGFDVPLMKKSITVRKTLVGDGAVYEKLFSGAYVSSVDFDENTKTILFRMKYDWCKDSLRPE